jgi:hypothetical protein
MKGMELEGNRRKEKWEQGAKLKKIEKNIDGRFISTIILVLI